MVLFFDVLTFGRFNFKGPGEKEFGDGFSFGVGAGGAGFDGLRFAGRDRSFDGLLYGGAVETGEFCDTGCLFEIICLHAYDQHRNGRLSFVHVRHGQHAGTHFGGHTKAGEVGGPEWILGKPSIGHGNHTMGFVYFPDPDAGKKRRWVSS